MVGRNLKCFSENLVRSLTCHCEVYILCTLNDYFVCVHVHVCVRVRVCVCACVCVCVCVCVYIHSYCIIIGPNLESLMNEMRQELAANPPLAGAFTPKKGAKCIAQFTDGLWLVNKWV